MTPLTENSQSQYHESERQLWNWLTGVSASVNGLIIWPLLFTREPQVRDQIDPIHGLLQEVV
jgi:hypothetical protein